MVLRKYEKLSLNVYSKCEMEESKPTITLRLTDFMKSSILEHG